MNRKKIKEDAKNLIKGNIWHILIPFLITGIITGTVSSLLSVCIKSELSNGLLSVVIGALLAPISFGATDYLMKFVRGQEHDLNLLFKYYNKLVIIFALSLLVSIFTTLWALLLFIPGIIAAISYSMSTFIMIDGEEDPMECIRKSKAMMKGYKWDFCKFIFSFFGWFLLIIPTFGLILIYVEPYLLTSEVLYYEELKKIN